MPQVGAHWRIDRLPDNTYIATDTRYPQVIHPDSHGDKLHAETYIANMHLLSLDEYRRERSRNKPVRNIPFTPHELETLIDALYATAANLHYQEDAEQIADHNALCARLRALLGKERA